MFAAHGLTQDPDSIRLIFLLIATGVVIFWRTVLKLVAIAVVLLGAWISPIDKKELGFLRSTKSCRWGCRWRRGRAD